MKNTEMNNRAFKKIVFYTLLLLNNILALGFIGISFLSGPGKGGEGTLALTQTDLFVRLLTYAAIVGLVFSGVSFLIGYLFRKTFDFSSRSLMYLPIIEFSVFIMTFLITYFVMFG
jgi:hypothetical protein